MLDNEGMGNLPGKDAPTEERTARTAVSEGKLHVVTVVVRSNGERSNERRQIATQRVVESVLERVGPPVVIVLPGGWFDAGAEEARAIYQWTEEIAVAALGAGRRDVAICLGVDGSHGADQIAVGIDGEGLRALGRKFFPAPSEPPGLLLADSYLATEDGKERILSIGGKRLYLCACYDSFGIRKENLPVPVGGVDAIVDLVHAFTAHGPGAGNGYYARYGFAGASKAWACPVFGAAVFFRAHVPDRWPSGVFWDQGNLPMQLWEYDHNPLRPMEIWAVEIPEGAAQIRLFILPE